MARRSLGSRGEDWAARYLQDRGYRILDRNLRLGRGEIDLVARQDGCIVLVEVKTYRAGFMAPEEALTPRKRRQIARLGSLYLQEHGMSDAAIRADVVAIEVGQDGSPQRITLYVNAIEEA
jgi:putative endonuclease